MRWLLAQSRAPRRRTMQAFAEQEIVVSTGPFPGRFRVNRQPFVRLLFGEIQSGRWRRVCITGPSQSGKTLVAFIVPLLYHLFEIGETVICGLPDMDMASDKWFDTIRPAIQRTRYRDLVPTKGGGSRGGKVDAVRFQNGAVLKFMSGGGSDKARAHFTSRVLVITETDGMDLTGGGSREADKITQLEARTKAYGSQARVYMECTVSVKAGRTWQEYIGGTESRIALPCPHCGGYVSPEREHLVGWKDAPDEVAARARAAFACPACGVAWTEAERRVANERGVLLHRGQEVRRCEGGECVKGEKGGEGIEIVGETPKVETLGFRWSAVNNLFRTAGDIAVDEWRGKRAKDEENAEKELRQFDWAVPYEPPEIDLTPLDRDVLRKRVSGTPRGLLPADTSVVTMGIDVGKYNLHYVLVAWRAGGWSVLADYGIVDVHSEEIGAERGLWKALHEFAETIMAGYTVEGLGARVPDQVWIDSRFLPDVVCQFCREMGVARQAPRFRPIRGFGVTQYRKGGGPYHIPITRTRTVKYIGEQYHIVNVRDKGVQEVEINADYWKSWVHERLATPFAQSGAMEFFQADDKAHTKLVAHLTAEKQTQKFVPGKGTVTVWETISRTNHWFDAAYIASAAGHLCGVRLTTDGTEVTERKKTAGVERREGRAVSRMRTGDGRPFLVTER